MSAANLVRCFTFSDQSANRVVGGVGRLAESVRSINPAGAATIFAVAFVAGWMGSVAALLVAAALFIGLYAARCATGSPAMPIEPHAADAAHAFGLPMKSCTFAAPTARKARKPAENAAE